MRRQCISWWGWRSWQCKAFENEWQDSQPGKSLNEFAFPNLRMDTVECDSRMVKLETMTLETLFVVHESRKKSNR